GQVPGRRNRKRRRREANSDRPVRTAVVELTVEKVDCDGGSGARVAYGVPRLRSRSTSAPIQNCLYAGSLADVLFGHTRVIGLASIDGHLARVTGEVAESIAQLVFDDASSG